VPDGVPTLANARMTQMLVSPFVKQASKRLKFCCIGVYICCDCCWLWRGGEGGGGGGGGAPADGMGYTGSLKRARVEVPMVSRVRDP